MYIPVIQREMDIFRETVWNSHRIRHQKDAQLPKGIPEHLFSFPEQYSAQDYGNIIIILGYTLSLSDSTSKYGTKMYNSFQNVSRSQFL